MGASDIRDAFNDVAKAYGLSCSRATLGYERGGGAEWQVMTFYGTGADNQPFTVRSDRVGAGGEILSAARVTAQRLVDQRSPK